MNWHVVFVLAAIALAVFWDAMGGWSWVFIILCGLYFLREFLFWMKKAFSDVLFSEVEGDPKNFTKRQRKKNARIKCAPHYRAEFGRAFLGIFYEEKIWKGLIAGTIAFAAFFVCYVIIAISKVRIPALILAFCGRTIVIYAIFTFIYVLREPLDLADQIAIKYSRAAANGKPLRQSRDDFKVTRLSDKEVRRMLENRYPDIKDIDLPEKVLEYAKYNSNGLTTSPYLDLFIKAAKYKVPVDHIIDALNDGIRVPESEWNQIEQDVYAAYQKECKDSGSKSPKR